MTHAEGNILGIVSFSGFAQKEQIRVGKTKILEILARGREKLYKYFKFTN